MDRPSKDLRRTFLDGTALRMPKLEHPVAVPRPDSPSRFSRFPRPSPPFPLPPPPAPPVAPVALACLSAPTRAFFAVSAGRVLPPGARLHIPRTARAFLGRGAHDVIARPPSGFDSWDDLFGSIGVSEDELGGGSDIIADPNGEGPRI